MSEEKKEINWWKWTFEEKYNQLNGTLEELKKCGRMILEIRSKAKKGRKNEEKSENEEKLEEDISVLYTDMNSSCKKGVDEVSALAKEEEVDVSKFRSTLEDAVKTWTSFKTKIGDKMKELDEEMMKSNEELVKACDLYNETCEKLGKACETEGVNLPWEIRYYLAMPPKKDNKERKITFKGGMITDRFGKRINEARCELSGIIIQHWGEGEELKRYRHMNESIHHSVELHDLLQQLIQQVNIVSKKHEEESSFKNIILSISEHAYDIFYLEDNVPSFLRMQVTDAKTCGDFIYQSFHTYKERLALGTSKLTISQRKNLVTFGKDEMVEYNDYLWLRFKDVGKYSIGLAKAFRKMMKKGSFVGVCGMNRNEFSICDFACAMSDMVMVGIHSTFDENGISHVIRNSKLSAIVCEEDMISTFSKIICDDKLGDHVKHIISMDHAEDFCIENELTNEQKVYFQQNEVSFHFIDDLSLLSEKCHCEDPLEVEINFKLRSEERKKKLEEERRQLLEGVITDELPKEEENEGEEDDDDDDLKTKLKKDDDDDVFTILYTSGSTGLAKGVIVSDHAFRTDCGSVILMYPLIGISFIPLSHSSDRIRIWEFLGNGGRIGFCQYAHTNWIAHEKSKKSGLVTSERDEKGKLSLNNVDKLMVNISKVEPLAVAFPPRIWNGLYTIYHQELVKNEIEKKMDPETAKKEAMEVIRSYLGPNIQVVATGGAPTSQKVMTWIQGVWASPILFMESYGTTEAGAITENNNPVRTCEIKLLDLPEKGFLNSDQPNPRGEIIVKTRTMSSGYLNNPNETKKAYDEHGWFHTGDLGTIDKETGKVYILERVKAVFSLESGTLICPNKLESMYESCESVKQIFLYGTAKQDFLVGIIVIDHLEEEKDVNVVKLRILKEMEEICKKEKGEKFDRKFIPKDVVVTKKTFTTENKMLNVQFKKVRAEIYKFWKEKILEMLEK